jgi:hypothetical protein
VGDHLIGLHKVLGSILSSITTKIPHINRTKYVLMPKNKRTRSVKTEVESNTLFTAYTLALTELFLPYV